MGSQQLVQETTAALEEYRLTLFPGAYCFASEILEGKPTGMVLELMMPFDDVALQDEYGVVFGFWPDGFMEDESGDQVPADPICVPPPIPGVEHLHQAPDSFLLPLMRHLKEKLAAIAEIYAAEAEAACGGDAAAEYPDSRPLVAQAKMAMEVYRRTVAPGVYLFLSEVREGKLTGRIIEERNDFPDPADQLKYEHGTAFSFWPWGVGADLVAGSPAPGQSPKVPLITSVAKLHLAPDHFLEMLAQHVNQKTGLN